MSSLFVFVLFFSFSSRWRHNQHRNSSPAPDPRRFSDQSLSFLWPKLHLQNHSNTTLLGKGQRKSSTGGKVLSTIKPKLGIGYVHSFGLTDNYVVAIEGPLIVDIWRALTHRIFATSPAKWLYWEPNQPTRFHVIDRQNGNQVGVFTADPFLVFHHINAFEKDGNIYLDICCYRNDSVINQIYLQNLRSPVQPGHKKFDIPEVRRYELPLGELEGVGEEIPLFKGGDGRDYTLLYVGMELPRINYAEHNGKPYRCVYSFYSVTRSKSVTSCNFFT